MDEKIATKRKYSDEVDSKLTGTHDFLAPS